MPNQQKKLINCVAILHPLLVKVFKSETTSLNSESLKISDIQLQEVGAKRRLNATSKVNIRTHTHKHMDGHFDLYKAFAQRANAFQILFSKTKIHPKNNFVCAAILHPVLVKVFKSETTSCNYFSQRILNPQNFWTSGIRKLGKKDI